MLKKYIFLILSISWALFILVSSLLPFADVPDVVVRLWDKLVHASVYFVLMALAGMHLKVNMKEGQLLKFGVICVLFGMVIEVLQYVMPYGRMFELEDVLANTIGVMAAISFFKFLLPWFSELKRKK